MNKSSLFLFTLIFSFALFSVNLFSQSVEVLPKTDSKKGTIKFYWGWNRAYYSDSDIHFIGKDHDFTLSNVAAADRPTPFSFENYLGLGKLSIPQVNYGFGYFINDHLEIAFKVDHMKYVVQRTQEVTISGSISNTNTEYDRSYDNEDFLLTPNFLQYEHTDGLNYLQLELVRYDNLFDLLGWHVKKIKLNTMIGFSAGALFPRTDAKLISYAERNKYHLSGFGFSPKMGLNIEFFKHFFLNGEVKAGYINLPDVKTTQFDSDKAKQSFFFFQQNIQLGFSFKINKK